MIEPTVGRVVNFFPGPFFQGTRIERAQPLAAIVVHVHDSRLVNLTVFDSVGFPCRALMVQLLQDDDKPAGNQWAEWMPYQKGQAAKTEQLEQKLSGGTA